MLSHDILINTLRPGRYIDHEWNATKKDTSRTKFSVCLCYPEVYEVGMSHLGIRILYEIINSKKDLVCERVFCPWPDLGNLLIKNSIELTSLESGISLNNFDLLGFSINNELNYSNILTMFSLSNLPLLREERRNNFPLIIAGGNCALNPEPIADFFDLFVIGEAEEIILDIVKICRGFKQRYRHVSKEKERLLNVLSQLPGVYVPSFYRVQYNRDSTVKEFIPLNRDAPKLIKKVYVKNLDKSLWPRCWLVPNIEIIHDRIGVEIMRGCAHQCRFCQARSSFFPLRIRFPENIISLAKKLYHSSGCEDISLLSLSSSDYPQLEFLVKSLIGYFSRNRVAISFPSIRAKKIIGYISGLLSSQRKTGLTFAPEAGTEKLRRIINKHINIDELFQVAHAAFESGYRRIKLYFMIGLPKEDYLDLDAIIDLSSKLSFIRKEVCGGAAEINISVSVFIPKPHTPFQWLPMAQIKEIIEKQQYLKKSIGKFRHKLEISFHNSYMSLLESALSRGSRDISKVIISAFKKGAQFDQWKECFNFDIWRNSFFESGLDIEEVATRPLFIENTLAWDFIHTGISKQYLIDEFQKALT